MDSEPLRVYIDAVEMKRRGAQAIYAATAQLTSAEQLAYWQQRTQALQQRQRDMEQAAATHKHADEFRTIDERLAQANYTGGRLFKTAEEVDEYIRAERDSWEQ